MNYSGSEPAELLMLRARLCGINTDAQTIQELSARMRISTDEEVQGLMIQIWASNIVEYRHDYNRLLALFYLANDVIQLLKGNLNSIRYRYKFIKAIAEAIIQIRTTCPQLINKIQRIVYILRDRNIYDPQTINYLLALLQTNDSMHAQSTILPSLLQHISVTNINFLISKQLMVHASSSTPPPSIVLNNMIPPPPINAYMDVINEKNLNKYSFPKRPQQAVNLDAELISRVQNYNIPIAAEMLSFEQKWSDSFKELLNQNKELNLNITSKVVRRQKEEDSSRYTIGLKNRSSNVTEKQIFLYKKEWQLRVKQLLFDRAIYWHLISLVDPLVERFDYLNELLIKIETELNRRNSNNS